MILLLDILSENLQGFWTLIQWTLFFVCFKFCFPASLACVRKSIFIGLLWPTLFQNGAHSSCWHQHSSCKKILRLWLLKIILLFRFYGPDQNWSVEELCVLSLWAVVIIKTRENVWFLRPRKNIKSNWIEKILLSRNSY